MSVLNDECQLSSNASPGFYFHLNGKGVFVLCITSYVLR
jgi:hypothetical protein